VPQEHLEPLKVSDYRYLKPVLSSWQTELAVKSFTWEKGAALGSCCFSASTP